jgi:hypothetical protein
MSSASLVGLPAQGATTDFDDAAEICHFLIVFSTNAGLLPLSPKRGYSPSLPLWVLPYRSVRRDSLFMYPSALFP